MNIIPLFSARLSLSFLLPAAFLMLGCSGARRGAVHRINWTSMNEVTRILSAIEAGDPHAAAQLLPLVYDELRRLAARRPTSSKRSTQASAIRRSPVRLRRERGPSPPVRASVARRSRHRQARR